VYSTLTRSRSLARPCGVCCAARNSTSSRSSGWICTLAPPTAFLGRYDLVCFLGTLGDQDDPVGAAAHARQAIAVAARSYR
jgi:hypothetical protein